MSSVDYVDQAKRMARFVEDDAFRRVGDRDAARREVEWRYRIAARLLYALRYRPPKEVAAGLYNALCTAFEDVASRQIKALENDIAEARAGRLGLDHSVVRKAEAALANAKSLIRERQP